MSGPSPLDILLHFCCLYICIFPMLLNISVCRPELSLLDPERRSLLACLYVFVGDSLQSRVFLALSFFGSVCVPQHPV